MKMAIHLRRAAALLLLVTASVVAIPSGPAHAEKPGGKPPVRRAADPPVNRAEAVPDSYVVVLKKAPPVAATSKRLATSFGGAVVRTFGRTVRGFELSGDFATAKRMAADPAVAYVQPNHRFRVTDVQSPTPSWGLDRVDQRSDVLDDSYTYATGAGNVRAYVLDTGIRTTHQDFEGRAPVRVRRH